MNTKARRNGVLVTINIVTSALVMTMIVMSIWTTADDLTNRLAATGLVFGVPCVIGWIIIGCMSMENSFDVEMPFKRRRDREDYR